MSKLSDQLSQWLSSRIQNVQNAFNPSVYNSPAQKFWSSPTANALSSAQKTIQQIPTQIQSQWNDIPSRTKYFQAQGETNPLRSMISSYSIGSNPINSFYQNKIRAPISTIYDIGKATRILPPSPHPLINKIGGSILESQLSPTIGGTPEYYKATNDLQKKIEARQPLNEQDKKLIKQLNAQHQTAIGYMAGPVTAISPEQADIILTQYEKSLGKEGMAKVRSTYHSVAQKYFPEHGGTEEAAVMINDKFTRGDFDWLDRLNKATPKQAQKLFGEGIPMSGFGGYLPEQAGQVANMPQSLEPLAPKAGIQSQVQPQGVVVPKPTSQVVQTPVPQVASQIPQITSSLNLDTEIIGKTPQIQNLPPEPPSIKSLKSPLEPIIPQEFKLLKAGEPKVYTLAQAKSMFKRSGKIVPYKVTLKSRDSVVNVPTGGWTGKKPYIEGRPITEVEANQISKWETDIGVKAYKGGLLSENFPAKVLSTSKISDKMPFSYQRETLLRNIEDTFGNQPNTGNQIKQYFYEPIIANETKSVEFKTGLRKDISKTLADLGITKKGSVEDMAAADLIEGNLTLEKLKTKFNGDMSKVENIVNAAEKGRQIYKDLLGRINKAIEPYGYSPIPERQNYVTHTRQISELTSRFGSLLNFSNEKLPTAMSSINMDVKPGKQFFKFGLQRQGGSTHEGLITALDKYINPAANQIFHTEDIQRGRTLIDYLNKSSNPQDKRLSNFNSYLSMYTDSLAGKKNVIDRPFEKVFGRKILSIGDWAKRRVGANMVGANISSALTNYIPFTQSIATTSKLSAIKGLYEGLKSPFMPVNIIDGIKSGYLTRNFPETESILPKLGERVIKKSGILFETVDKFTKRSVIAGKYFDGLNSGLNPEQSMAKADEYGVRVLVDRSYGQVPLIFGSKTLGMFTQFQTEVNNQMSFVLKDIPKNLGYNKFQIASALAQFTVLCYVFNNIYERVTGRRPQIDPIHLVQSYVQGLQQGNSPMSMLNPTDSNTPVGEFVSNLPFNPTGGRLPIGAAIPNPFAVVAGTSTVGKELKKPLYYLLPPTAGGQIKKTIEGIGAYTQGANITDKGQVRFPIEQNPQNLARTTLFGQYSTPESINYFNTNATPLSENQSLLFKAGANNYQDVQNRRSQTKELNKLKDNKISSKAIKLTEDLFQVGDKFYSKQLDQTFDTQQKAEIAVAKENFDKSGKNYAEVNNMVFRRDAQNNITAVPKVKFDYQVGTAKLTQYKNDDNLDEWLKVAKSQLESIQTQLQDSSIDPLDSLQLQNDAHTLIDNVAKYSSYGGFTKPKKLKAVKVPKVTFKKTKKTKLAKLKIKPLGTTRQKSTLWATPKLKAPSGVNLEALRNPKMS